MCPRFWVRLQQMHLKLPLYTSGLELYWIRIPICTIPPVTAQSISAVILNLMGFNSLNSLLSFPQIRTTVLSVFSEQTWRMVEPSTSGLNKTSTDVSVVSMKQRGCPKGSKSKWPVSVPYFIFLNHILDCVGKNWVLFWIDSDSSSNALSVYGK